MRAEFDTAWKNKSQFLRHRMDNGHDVKSSIMKRCALVLSLEEHRYNGETADAGGEQA